MKIAKIQELLHAELLTGGEYLDHDVWAACCSDMMSDVLAFVKDQGVLLTGLLNSQVIRTANMMDMVCVVIVRNKVPTEEMIELAEDVFLKPVRVAVPEYEGSLADVMRNPRFSTVMGLLQEARMQRVRGRKVAAQTGNFKSLLAHMKEWFMN